MFGCIPLLGYFLTRHISGLDCFLNKLYIYIHARTIFGEGYISFATAIRKNAASTCGLWESMWEFQLSGTSWKIICRHMYEQKNHCQMDEHEVSYGIVRCHRLNSP